MRLEGKSTILELITMEDCQFVADLRSLPEINKFLSNDGEISIENQQKWLSNFLLESKDYYFIIKDKKSQKRTGTISLYAINQKERKAEFGRYICTNNLNAIESELMILNFAFIELKLAKVYCLTVDDNINVWNQHYKYGFEDVGFEEMKGAKQFRFRKQEIDFDKYKLFDYSKLSSIINKFSV
jgi:RimJ/RimL family protein N-acetyltransferase